MSVEKVNKVFERLEKGGVVRVGQINLSYNDLSRLRRNDFLNDEVINAYLELITSGTNCYLFNTFFYFMLEKKGYKAVKGWTRQDNIFSYNKVLIPIHMNDEMHWCLIIIDMKKQVVEFIDSDRGDYTGKRQIEVVYGYLINEYKRVTGGIELEWDVWRDYCVNVPQQINDHDCGVMMCQFAKMIVEERSLSIIDPYLTRSYRDEMILTLVK